MSGLRVNFVRLDPKKVEARAERARIERNLTARERADRIIRERREQRRRCL